MREFRFMSRVVRIILLLGLTASVVQAAVVYQDDFSGAVGSATNSVPEITVPGWAGATANAMELDGAGKLESSDAGNAAANYRFRIATDPLTTNPTNEIINDRTKYNISSQVILIYLFSFVCHN